MGIASTTSHISSTPLVMQHIHETWHTQTYTYQSDLPLILVGWCSLSASPSPSNNIGQEQLTSGRHTLLNEYDIPSSEQHCLWPCQEQSCPVPCRANFLKALIIHGTYCGRYSFPASCAIYM